MVSLKNILVGFLVSFLGSIPLGYLNIVGYEVYKKSGFNDTVFYLLGVVTVEFFVIYFTLVFAKRLIRKTSLIKFIEAFSVVFMFLLAYIFYSSANSEVTGQTVLQQYINYAPYVVGLILSGLNFINIPFWASWNLYLLNEQHIQITGQQKYVYVFGTLLGTFAGMVTLILSLDFLTNTNGFFAQYLMKYIIPVGFMALGIFQAFKFYKKYYS